MLIFLNLIAILCKNCIYYIKIVYMYKYVHFFTLSYKYFVKIVYMYKNCIFV